MLKDIFRSSGWSVLITFILVLLFAIVVKAAALGEGAITPVVIGIKIASVLFGSLKGIRQPDSGWIKGLAIGVLYWAVMFAVFALLNGGADFNFIDMACLPVVGLISAVIKVNILK